MKKSTGITLLEVLIALTILSTILLPIGMFLIEYMKGSSQIGDSHQIMNLLEEKMELALSKPFAAFPIGTSENLLLSYGGKEILDLRPVEVGPNLVKFSLVVESVPVQFSAYVEPESGKTDSVRLEDGLKRLTIKGVWGKNTEHFLDLVAFKADL